MTPPFPATDIKRRGGWLPDGQGALEAWLTGHRERVEGKGERELHPVLQEFAELLDRDPVLRMYAERMIAEVPKGKPYTKRHLESVDQLLRLIDEVLTMAPEFGDQGVTIPLGAILDWTTGTEPGSPSTAIPGSTRCSRRSSPSGATS
jgi:phosphatidylserine decarboxylase